MIFLVFYNNQNRFAEEKHLKTKIAKQKFLQIKKRTLIFLDF